MTTGKEPKNIPPQAYKPKKTGVPLGGYAVLPTLVILDRRLDLTMLRILGYLAAYNWDNGWCPATVGQLGDDLGIDYQEVAEALERLLSMGHIQRAWLKDSETGEKVRVHRIPL